MHSLFSRASCHEEVRPKTMINGSSAGSGWRGRRRRESGSLAKVGCRKNTDVENRAWRKLLSTRLTAEWERLEVVEKLLEVYRGCEEEKRTSR